MVLAYGSGMTSVRPEQKQDEALRDLERLEHEGSLLTGLLRPTTAPHTDMADPIERWGRLIGRALAAVAFIGFCVYFYLAYVH